MVSEDRKRLGLFAQMSVHNNIVMCFLKRIARFGWIRGKRERNSSMEQSRSPSHQGGRPDASILSLSGGNQQKCIIARCLLINRLASLGRQRVASTLEAKAESL